MLSSEGFDLWSEDYDRSVPERDGEEAGFAAEELRRDFPQLRFEPFSPCTGLISLKKY